MPISLERVPQEPIEVRHHPGEGPRIYAGGIPVSAVNLALKRRVQAGATPASISSYARSAELYLTFCSRRGISMMDVDDQAFADFIQEAHGVSEVRQRGRRARGSLGSAMGPRSVDLTVTLLYSIAGDIEASWPGIEFGWRNYGETLRGSRRRGRTRRTHRVRYARRKVFGLPEEQFVQLLSAARSRWVGKIASGDVASVGATADLEQLGRLRGALWYRNKGIFNVMGLAGVRRSEVCELDVVDVDTERRLLWVPTKGRRGQSDSREPVPMLRVVENALHDYILYYRPTASGTESVEADGRYPLFVSHGSKTFGHRLSHQAIRKLVNTVRVDLEPPWSSVLTPHQLRHMFYRVCQRAGIGEAGLTVLMRHRSIASQDPYMASAESYIDELARPDGQWTERLHAVGL